MGQQAEDSFEFSVIPTCASLNWEGKPSVCVCVYVCVCLWCVGGVCVLVSLLLVSAVVIFFVGNFAVFLVLTEVANI